MKVRIYIFMLGILSLVFTYSPVQAEERTVSPLICGANTMFDMAGMYYGTLPKSDPASRREEFMKILRQINIRLLRFPGGTGANSMYLADHPDIMRTVLGVKSLPERDPEKVTGFWQFLDFCKEADITPLYQVNMLLYTDGQKVYQIAEGAGTESMLPPSPTVTLDISKRSDAAKALTELVKKVREKGYTIKHWELGNEEYGHPVMKAADYADLARRFIKAIRAADPDAMIWVTLGSNHCDEWTKKNVIPWSNEVLQRLKIAGFTRDKNLGFTLHYVWPGYYIDVHKEMVKKYGFKPRFAITEFHLAGVNAYWDLSPRFGYALALAPYLIGTACDPAVEIVDIHELTSQNYGIIHFNQRSYESPGMPNWDPKLGYQLMPSAYVYELFGQMIDGRILPVDTLQNTRLVVEKGKERLIFFVNATVNPMIVKWDRNIVGSNTKQFECQTIIPNMTAQKNSENGNTSAAALGRSESVGDPLRADQIKRENQSGSIGATGLELTVPSYSINLIRCFKVGDK